MAKEYNGHKCWAYWNVALYLFNEEDNYRMVQSEVKRASTLDIAAQNILNKQPPFPSYSGTILPAHQVTSTISESEIDCLKNLADAECE